MCERAERRAKIDARGPISRRRQTSSCSEESAQSLQQTTNETTHTTTVSTQCTASRANNSQTSTENLLSTTACQLRSAEQNSSVVLRSRRARVPASADRRWPLSGASTDGVVSSNGSRACQSAARRPRGASCSSCAVQLLHVAAAVRQLDEALEHLCVVDAALFPTPSSG
jgi:hypothetical protein